MYVIVTKRHISLSWGFFSYFMIYTDNNEGNMNKYMEVHGTDTNVLGSKSSL